MSWLFPMPHYATPSHFHAHETHLPFRSKTGTYSNLENHPRMISVAKRNNGKQKALVNEVRPPIIEAEEDGEETASEGSGSETEREGTVGCE